MADYELPKELEVEHSAGQLAHVAKSLTLTEIPSSVEELAQRLRDLGHSLVIHSFEYAGERSSGWLAKMSLDGQPCIVKFSGPATDDLYVVYSAGVQTERDGLALMTGYAPRLVAEVKVDGEIVAVFREYIERGSSLERELHEGKLSREIVLEKAQGIAVKLAESGLRLYDPCLDNIWVLEDGSVILIEGQCAVPSTDDFETTKAHNLKFAEAMIPD